MLRAPAESKAGAARSVRIFLYLFFILPEAELCNNVTMYIVADAYRLGSQEADRDSCGGRNGRQR